MGWQWKPQRGTPLIREGGFSLCNTAVMWKFIVSLTGYCKKFSGIPLFTVLLLFYLFCIQLDWQAQKCNLECPKFMRLTLNYSVCTAIYACSCPCDTNSSTHSLRRYIYCNWKYISEWSFFEIKIVSIYA